MDEKKEITTEDREELEYPLVIPEEKESRDLWSNIKELRKKFRKPEVVPEEFRLPEFTTPLERKEADAHQGLSKAEVDDRVARDAVNHAVGSASKYFHVFQPALLYYCGHADCSRIVP